MFFYSFIKLADIQINLNSIDYIHFYYIYELKNIFLLVNKPDFPFNYLLKISRTVNATSFFRKYRFKTFPFSF